MMGLFGDRKRNFRYFTAKVSSDFGRWMYMDTRDDVCSTLTTTFDEKVREFGSVFFSGRETFHVLMEPNQLL